MWWMLFLLLAISAMFGRYELQLEHNRNGVRVTLLSYISSIVAFTSLCLTVFFYISNIR